MVFFIKTYKMNIDKLRNEIDGIDIYLLDQILKKHFKPESVILDAGCGSGRNLKWFYKNNFEIHGVDSSIDDIEYCKEIYKEYKNNFVEVAVEDLSFESNKFDHIICNAVLHFAKDVKHFKEMFTQLNRVLKPGGSLFIRMASNFGMENKVQLLNDGVYRIPDGSFRFLLTEEILNYILETYSFVLLENVKTTVVKNKRCMTTLVLKKE